MFAPNNNPGFPKCIVSAPTGKAADNIGGMTLHSAYTLLPNQNKKASGRGRSAEEDEEGRLFDSLKPESLAQLQNQFCDMYGQLIDEISMVSQAQLLAVDERCQDATDRKGIPFGGLWTIVFGDFRYVCA